MPPPQRGAGSPLLGPIVPSLQVQFALDKFKKQLYRCNTTSGQVSKPAGAITVFQACAVPPQDTGAAAMATLGMQ